MSDAGTAAGTQRRALWPIVLGVVAAALVLAAVLISQRLAIARTVIDSQLRVLGLEEVSHEVERLGFREFEVRNLQVGRDDDLSAEKITARYSLDSLLSGRLAELKVSGVRLHGRVDETGISFGALDPLWRRETDAASSTAAGAVPMAALPARHVAVDDFLVELETPQGPVATTLHAEVNEGIRGRIAARASLETQHALFAGAARFDAAGTSDAFEGSAALELKAGGEIVPGTELEPTTLATDARFAYSKEMVEVAIAPTAFAFAVQRPGGTLRLEGESPALSLTMPPTPAGDSSTIQVTAKGGRFEFPDLGFEAHDLSVEVAVDQSMGPSTGSLRIGSLNDTEAVRRVCELAIAATLDTTGAQRTFGITATNPGKELVIDVRGSHDARSGEGSARVEMQPVDFQLGSLQPAAFSPLLANEILEASGGVDVRGEFRWNAETDLHGAFDVALRDLSISSANGSFERLNAAIRINGPWPPSTPPRQLISMARMDFGLALTNGLISFQLRPDGVLAIDSARWSLAGGTIRTRAELDPLADSQKLVLEVADLDLAELLKLADLDGLSGSGTLHGRIPVTRRGPILEIRGGTVSSTSEGGWIRYGADVGPLGVSQPQEGFNVAFAALENFHYEKLEATLDGDTAGPVNVSIHLAGANPDYLGGHPIEFNLGIESHLVDLLKNATAVYQIPAEIEKRLEEMSKKSP